MRICESYACVCTCIRTYVYMHMRIRIHACAHTYTCICAYVNHVHVCVPVCRKTSHATNHVRASRRVGVAIAPRTYMVGCVCVCVCVCVCAVCVCAQYLAVMAPKAGATCMPHLYASFARLICTPYIYALSVCLACMPHPHAFLYALYVRPICTPYMYALYVCSHDGNAKRGHDDFHGRFAAAGPGRGHGDFMRGPALFPESQSRVRGGGGRVGTKYSRKACACVVTC